MRGSGANQRGNHDLFPRYLTHPRRSLIESQRLSTFPFSPSGGNYWTTLESVVNVADTENRRRFLLEKYPHLAEEASEPVRLHAQEGVLDGHIVDDEFSALEEIVEAGGPDLR